MRWAWIIGTTGAAVLAAAGGLPEAPEVPGSAPDFTRHIRPLLADRCYKCHGPDAAARRAGLRLDRRADALAARDGAHAIVPGDPAASLLVDRIGSSDAGFRMPPVESNKTLAPDEIELLRAWIAAGAPWDDHWAFVPPRRDAPPPVRDAAWPRNPIDRFVLARLEAEGLAPAPEADPQALIRRVSFDLTGLPPTVAEIDAFLADTSAGAYERVVDRLLASPRYGERMAQAWLDLARYADTHGYHYDNERTMWPWRDWVIDAYNRNLPFDRFTTEQLAGDLLPGATPAQRIATGFNRNHGISWEGGIIPEEYLAEYVADRVQTTATTWLGLTVGCARCHDHKFDPVSQREFYRMAAFFNAVPEKGADGITGNAVPFMPAPGTEEAARLAALTERVAGLEARYGEVDPVLENAMTGWDARTRSAWRAAWHTLRPLSYVSASRDGGATLALEDDGSVFAGGALPATEVYEVVAVTPLENIRAVRLEAMADERLPRGGPGRASHANIVLTGFEVQATSIADPALSRRVRWDAAHADHSQRGFNIARAIDGDPMTGWALEGARFGEDRVALFKPAGPIGFAGGTALKITIRHESMYTQHAIGRFRLSVTADEAIGAAIAPCVPGPWHVAGPFTGRDGPAAHTTDFGPETGAGDVEWRARPELADGALHALGETENAAVYLKRTVTAPSARRGAFALGSDDAVKLWVNGDLVHAAGAPRPGAVDQDIVEADLREGPNEILLKVTNYGGAHAFAFDRHHDTALDPPLAILTAMARPPDERTPGQARDVRDFYLAQHSPAHGALLAELDAARAERDLLAETVPTVMVMQQMAEPRPTHVLMRGRYDQPGDEVAPGVPSVLGALPDGAPPNRLGLAMWLTDPANPLTARVAVNRSWQMLFGRGMVETPEDFGAQGSPPTHPALLDWLACEFVETGWDVKALLRLIVTSATYRQSAALTSDLAALDPDNRLLARGPRFRLPAEMIRDSALLAGGLLVERIGGPPVKPYQPEGLWKEVGSDFAAFSANVYQRDTGEALYRRTLYTFWKRTLPPPALAIFDAPTREFCVARRGRTNTPLQALVLMNDLTYVEAARFLAQRLLTELPPGAGHADRARRAFRIATSRHPGDDELDLLVALYEAQRAAFAADPDAAEALLATGEKRNREDLDRADLAAWTITASVLLNLDEALSR